MILRLNLKKLIISLLVPLGVGGLSALITGGNMDIYSKINRPPLSPPGIVFPIVWSILYTLMGISLYLVWNKNDNSSQSNIAYFWFAVQLFLNFIWSPIFFGAQQYLVAFIVLILLIASVVAMIISFYKISKPAALLQIPYLIWLIFAGYLNLAIYILN
ncbi:MAG: TspO/MBR family protein [Acutalibacteraceae bacterium]|nr:TspO/MBR family protein [Acutalibacteraceae bacterium]